LLIGNVKLNCILHNIFFLKSSSIYQLPLHQFLDNCFWSIYYDKYL